MDRDTQIRKLKYLARRRSTLELDRMLGSIADRLPWDDLNDQDLEDLAAIIEMDDLTLQKALFGQTPMPPGVREDLWDLMVASLKK